MQTKEEGFSKILGATASASWRVVSEGGDINSPVKVRLDVEGIFDPLSIGECKYNASYLVSGDGTLERQSIRVYKITAAPFLDFNFKYWGSGGYSIEEMRDGDSSKLSASRRWRQFRNRLKEMRRIQKERNNRIIKNLEKDLRS